MRTHLKISLILLLPLRLWSQEPISLLMPADGDTIETKNPLISWLIPGGNPGANPREYYRLVVVELKKDQSPEAGITMNVPVLKIDHANLQTFYPYDAPELKEGKHYGWQVQKIVNNVTAYKSEAWEFILAVPPDPVYAKYATLKKHHDGTIYQAVDGKIFFTMEESYYSKDLKAYIYDDQRHRIKRGIEDDKESGQNAGEFDIKSNGSNFYELDLGAAVQTGTYELQVFDAKDQSYILKFRVP